MVPAIDCMLQAAEQSSIHLSIPADSSDSLAAWHRRSLVGVYQIPSLGEGKPHRCVDQKLASCLSSQLIKYGIPKWVLACHKT